MILLMLVEFGVSIGMMGNLSVQVIGLMRYSRFVGLICGRFLKMLVWILLSLGNICGVIFSKFVNGVVVCCVLINCELKILVQGFLVVSVLVMVCVCCWFSVVSLGLGIVVLINIVVLFGVWLCCMKLMMIDCLLLLLLIVVMLLVLMNYLL